MNKHTNEILEAINRLESNHTVSTAEAIKALEEIEHAVQTIFEPLEQESNHA